MTAAADAAMTAIETALRKPLIARLMNRLGISPLKCIPAENRRALAVIKRQMAGHPVDDEQLRGALDLVILRIQPALARCGWQALLDDDVALPTLDEDEIDRARSLVLRGEVGDCLHHLERALPAEYAVIAERLAHHFRSRT